MFTPTLRIIFIFLSLLIAAFLYSKEEYVIMVPIFISVSLFILDYFKSGTVYIAFKELKKGNLKKAEKLILKTKNPEGLSKGQKGYYYFITGFIAMNKENSELAYSELSKALKIGLRTENDTSIVLLNLAKMEFIRGNFMETESLILRIKKLSLSENIASETGKIEDELQKRQTD